MWSSRWNENWQGKLKYSEKTCSRASLPPQISHDLTWDWTGAGEPANNRLSYGTAKKRKFPSRVVSLVLITLSPPALNMKWPGCWMDFTGPWSLFPLTFSSEVHGRADNAEILFLFEGYFMTLSAPGLCEVMRNFTDKFWVCVAILFRSVRLRKYNALQRWKFFFWQRQSGLVKQKVALKDKKWKKKIRTRINANFIMI
jgi:hypothetical protein